MFMHGNKQPAATATAAAASKGCHAPLFVSHQKKQQHHFNVLQLN